jgi:hypothetical protein
MIACVRDEIRVLSTELFCTLSDRTHRIDSIVIKCIRFVHHAIIYVNSIDDKHNMPFDPMTDVTIENNQE